MEHDDDCNRSPDTNPYWMPTKHHNKRRAPWHDYSKPGWYMLTIVTEHRRCLLGRLAVDPLPHIIRHPFGEQVITTEIPKISHYYPNISVVAVMIMPDHIHIIVHVTDDFPSNKSLGNVIAGFKVGCNRCLRSLTGNNGDIAFEKGYHDRIIMGDRHIKQWKAYLLDNPRRLALKHQHRDLFRAIYNVELCGKVCQIFGNRFLLDNPDKEAVIVHRKDTDAEYRANTERWLNCGDRGGVLVSAAIAPREKEVLSIAMERGYNIIWLRNNGFPPIYKPSGRAFDACAEGTLLQISPWQYQAAQQKITRQQCLELNALALSIATQ